MKNFKIITFISFLLILFSCEKEENIKIQNTNIDNVSIKDGRLSFQSIESLQRVYKEYADATDEKLASYLQPLYKKGFYSLRPIVTESNENFLYYHYTKNDSTMRKSNHRSQEDVFDYLDDLEDIIGDDTFSAFLNNNAEILVADKIYKYTDVGLFISNEDKYNNLLSYLDEKNVSQNIIEETPLNIKTNLFNEFPSDGINTINPDIKYFKVAPMDPDTDGGGSGAPYTPTPGSPASTDPSYNAFLNNLGSCQIQHGLFTTWFGENDVCIDKYESRRRVKTKAFNYNYLIVYHMGVKCVHQYRGWTGFWRLEATDEIRLVVEAAQFEYDLDALLGNNAINNQTREQIYYMNNQKAYFAGPNTITFNNQWGLPTITYYNLNSLPAIFQDNLSFEFFGTGIDWLDNQIQNGIDTNLEASNLNQQFYSTLYSTLSSQLQKAFGNNTQVPQNRTFVAKFPQNGKMIFQKSVALKEYNVGYSEKTFDWGAEFSFNASTSGDSGWRMSGGAGNVLVRPKNFRVKIIGAARRGDVWHGSKFNNGIN